MKTNEYSSAQNPIATLTDYSPHLSLPRKITQLPSALYTWSPRLNCFPVFTFQKSLFSTGYRAGRATRNHCLYYFQSIRNSTRDFSNRVKRREKPARWEKRSNTQSFLFSLSSIYRPHSRLQTLAERCTYQTCSVFHQ